MEIRSVGADLFMGRWKRKYDEVKNNVSQFFERDYKKGISFLSRVWRLPSGHYSSHFKFQTTKKNYVR